MNKTVISLLFGLVVLFIITVPVSAAAIEWQQFEKAVNVSPFKEWKITFNDDFLPVASEEQVFVEDSAGNRVPIMFGKDSEVLYVYPPSQGYQRGETYTLYVKEMTSGSGERLKQPVSKTFSIVEEMDPQIHTKEDIVQKWDELKPTASLQDFYTVEPSYKAPYRAGQLKESVQEDGINAVNFVRYLAGLPADVEVDPQLRDLAAHGAVLLAANNYLSHYPEQPADMEQAFYERGYQSTSSSNIAAGYSSIADSIFQGYMRDDDQRNREMVGHRRWILNPNLTKTGFGFADRYSTLQAFDNSRTEKVDYDTINWPNKGAFPVEFFDEDDPWSISLNPFTYQSLDENEVFVTVKDKTTNKTWTFNQEQEDGFYTINKEGYGEGDTIIFVPEGIEIAEGRSFVIEVGGLTRASGEQTSISYQVDFFQLEKEWAATLAQNGEPIEIPDANFEQAIREKLQYPTGPITKEMMRSIGYFDLYGCQPTREWDLSSKGIENLSGIEHAEFLNVLNVEENQIEDLTPLAGITSLEVLRASNNQIHDLGPLSGLTNLRMLWMGQNEIQDLAPIKTLTSLQSVLFWMNQIRDVSPLESLMELNSVRMDYNPLSEESIQRLEAMKTAGVAVEW